MKQPFDAVLFDLDGTLIDGYLAIANSASAVRKRFGLPPVDVDEVRPLVGQGIDTFVKRVIPHGNVTNNVALYREHYAKHMVAGTRLFTAAPRLLEDLYGAGKRLGVCSNKLAKFSVELLKELNVAFFFDAVLGPEHVTNAKPAPDMLLEAAKQLGVTPDRTLYVGDMSIDVIAARSAGMAIWVVATGSETVGQLHDSRPDRVFIDLFEVHGELFPLHTNA